VVLDALLSAFSGPGGAFMYAITAVLAFGLAVALERGFLLLLRWTCSAEALLEKVDAGDLAGARTAAGSHPVASLLAAAEGHSSADGAWDAMSARAALVETTVTRRVPYLATVGNIATMLGLLGTVYGLILAFEGLGDASAVERATRLSEGIATAMSTTAYGLIVGIPALALHALLDGRARSVLALCEAAAGAHAARLRRS
jgi:biopolymer transport protein ExbB/TolQ